MCNVLFLVINTYFFLENCDSTNVTTKPKPTVTTQKCKYAVRFLTAKEHIVRNQFNKSFSSHEWEINLALMRKNVN